MSSLSPLISPDGLVGLFFLLVNLRVGAPPNERTETLKKVLKEAGVVLYSQSGQAQKGGPGLPWHG